MTCRVRTAQIPGEHQGGQRIVGVGFSGLSRSIAEFRAADFPRADRSVGCACPDNQGGHLGRIVSPFGVWPGSRGSNTPVCDFPHFGQTGTIGRTWAFSYSL